MVEHACISEIDKISSFCIQMKDVVQHVSGDDVCSVVMC